MTGPEIQLQQAVNEFLNDPDIKAIYYLSNGKRNHLIAGHYDMLATTMVDWEREKEATS